MIDERTIKMLLNSIQTPEYDIVSEVERGLEKGPTWGFKGMFLSDWRFVFVLYLNRGNGGNNSGF